MQVVSQSINYYTNGSLFSVPYSAVFNKCEQLVTGVDVVITVSEGLAVNDYTIPKGSWDAGTNTWHIGGVLPNPNGLLDASFEFIVNDSCFQEYEILFTITSDDTCEDCFDYDLYKVIITGVSCCLVSDCVDYRTGSTLYVSNLYGNDLTAVKGDPSRPWRTPWSAIPYMSSGDTMHVFASTYTVGDELSGADLELTGTVADKWDATCLTTSATESDLNFYFEEGVTISIDSTNAGIGLPLFSDVDSSGVSYGIAKHINVDGYLVVEITNQPAFTNDFKVSGTTFKGHFKHIIRNSDEPNYWGLFNCYGTNVDVEIDHVEGQFLYGYILPKDGAIVNYKVKRSHWYHVGTTPWDAHLLMLGNENGATVDGTLNFYCDDFLFEADPTVGSFLGAPLVTHTGGAGVIPAVNGLKVNVYIKNYKDTEDFTDNATGINNSNMYAHFYLGDWARSSDWANVQINILVDNMDTGRMLFDGRKYGVDVVKMTNSIINVHVKNGIFRSTRVGVLGTQWDMDSCYANIKVDNAIIHSSVAYYVHGTSNAFSNGTRYIVNGRYKILTAGSSAIEFSNAAQTQSVAVENAVLITDGTAFDLMSPAAVDVFIMNVATNVAVADVDVTEVGDTVIRDANYN